MPFKVVHFFRDTEDGLGWSEVWYVDLANFDLAEAAGKLIANQRVRLLHPDCVLEWQRITGNQPADNQHRARQPRASTLQKLGYLGLANANNNGADLPWTAVKVRWAGVDISIFRTQLLRGVPDDFWNAGNDKLGDAAVKNWIAAMIPSLTVAAARIRHLNAVVPPATFRTYRFEPPGRGTYEGFTRRATGRPFNLPRGRRPNRA